MSTSRQLGFAPPSTHHNAGRVRCYSTTLKKAMFPHDTDMYVKSQGDHHTSRKMSATRYCQGKHWRWHTPELDPDYVEKRKQHHMQKFNEKQQIKLYTDQLRDKETIRRNINREEHHFKKMLSRLDEAKIEVAEIETVVAQQDARNLARKENLYHAWNERVFKPIQLRIQANMTPKNIEVLHKKRYHLYMEYLTADDQFADIINTHKYNPMRWTAFDMGISTADIKDPLKRDLQQIAKEKSFITRKRRDVKCEKKSSTSRLDVLQWGAMQIRASPHGHFFKTINDEKMKIASQSLTHTSKFVDTHFCHFKLSSFKFLIKYVYKKKCWKEILEIRNDITH